ncbi:hypothetical protein NWE55_00795 [Myroides albus]|uniref:hypothetical protein n=1 Tax=Myroides albus TaxID=2562892 RepID=UPI002158B238|nr:hypothetical protein [Myroides albus]UVD79861.1 hypothetical protein NWE55_00795 [Myroides albus]
MKKIKALYFLSLLFTTSIAHAFQEDLGSAYKKNYTNYKVSDSIFPKSFWNSESVKITFVPTIFFGSTAITWNGREHILETRNKYIPEFANTFDDYLQYAPGALAFGLKASGVKGRNNIRRSVYNYAGSMLITGIFVNSLKYSTKVMRPDGSTTNSWPSGHAATAFAKYAPEQVHLVRYNYSSTTFEFNVL